MRPAAPKRRKARRRGPQATKFAGGYRSRVTPVPIPNTEVKPTTADGTAWETVWESRSLPALSRKARWGKPCRAFSFVRTPSEKPLFGRISVRTQQVALRGIGVFLRLAA